MYTWKWNFNVSANKITHNDEIPFQSFSNDVVQLVRHIYVEIVQLDQIRSQRKMKFYGDKNIEKKQKLFH